MQRFLAALSAAPVCTVVLLGLLMLLPGNAVLPLLDRDEPRFAEATREMLQRADFIVPHFNGDYRFDKPPLIYWCQAVSFRLLGQNAFAARFPSVLFSVGTALLLVFWGRSLDRPQVGFHAALIFLSCLQVLIHGRLSVADLPLIFFVTLAVWSGWELMRQQSPGRSLWVALLALSFGLGFLAKGPIAWLPLIGLLSTKFVRPLICQTSIAPFLAAFACGLVLLAAWGIPALLATHGQFFVVGIGRHVIERSFGILDSHGLSGVLGYLALLPFYLLTFFFSFFPWALKFPAALRSWWPRRLSDDLGWYLLAQATVVFATFSLVRTRLPHYTLPAFPCLALWLALQLDHPAATAQIFRSVGAMILLTLLLTLGAAPFASRHIVTAQLARQLRPVLKPRSQVAVLGLSEPSLVWELRGLTTNFLSYFPVARLSSEFQRQPPWCIILPTDTLQSHTDLIPTNATLIRAVGVETAGFHRWDLTAVILP